MTLRYLPLGLTLSAHTVTQDNDDPDLLDAVLKLLESAYAEGYEDGYTRGITYKEAKASAERERAKRRADDAEAKAAETRATIVMTGPKS